jgi:hypothetical protein
MGRADPPLTALPLQAVAGLGGKLTIAEQMPPREKAQMNEHELGFTTFLAGPTQRRMRTLLELGPKRRKDVRALLDHSIRLDRRFAQHLDGAGDSARLVEAALKRLGAPATCYVISADEALDGQEMPLSDALNAVEPGHFGAFISCIPGKLSYFRYEDAKSAYLLEK